MSDFTFTREERLKSRKVIQRLFGREGESFGHYPLRIIWVFLDAPLSSAPVQFGLSVPKKNFKKAVHRNRIRRLLREAYRLNKHRLYRSLEGEDRQLACMVLYTGREELPFAEIERAMRDMLRRFAKKHRSQKKGT